jgi:hypothetical protein
LFKYLVSICVSGLELQLWPNAFGVQEVRVNPIKQWTDSINSIVLCKPVESELNSTMVRVFVNAIMRFQMISFWDNNNFIQQLNYWNFCSFFINSKLKINRELLINLKICYVLIVGHLFVSSYCLNRTNTWYFNVDTIYL